MEEKNKIIIYKTDGGQTRLEVKLVNETVWLSQKLRRVFVGRGKCEKLLPAGGQIKPEAVYL